MVVRRLDTVITGTRTPAGAQVLVVEGVDGRPLLHRAHHSPTGYEWGYDGSGPADLALSILAYCLDLPDPKVETSQLLDALPYQAYKSDVVAHWPRDGFKTTVAEVREWLHDYLDAEDTEALKTPEGK